MDEDSLSGEDATLDAVDDRTRREHDLDGPSLEPGQNLGRYVLLERIGSGGMGVVYSAYDPELDRKVAIKLLHSRGPESASRMMREAQAMAKVDHANVVAVHDVGRIDDAIFVAMEFADGATLRVWLDTEQHPLQSVLTVLMDSGRGLLAAHRAGLVHRDFKPDNVLVSPRADGSGWRTRVTDFGLARASDDPPVVADTDSVPDQLRQDAFATPLTQAGSVMGTPRYMAPEQHLGLATDERTDQFSFCVTAWEALAKRHPFAADSATAMALSVLDSSPSGGESIPAWIRSVLERGMAKRPEARWASMAELLDALGRDPRRSRRRWGAIAATMVLLGAGASGWQLKRSSQESACAVEGRGIEAVWNSASSNELARAMESVDDPYAAEAARRGVEAVEAFARAWQTTREQSCLATELRRTRSSEFGGKARSCLDDSLARLQESLDIYAGVESIAQVHTIARDLSTLPDPVQCDDEELLRHWPSTTSGDAAQHDELRRTLARVRPLNAMGRRADAADAAKRGRTIAQHLGDDRLLARATYAHASAESANERWQEAEALLDEAFVLAMASGDDLLAGRIASSMAFMVRAGRRDLGEALLWGRFADSLLTRGGHADTLVAANHAVLLADVMVDHGDLEDAERALERALAIFERELGSDHLDYAAAMEGMADLAAERGDWKTADHWFARTIEMRERILGTEHRAVADTLLSMGAMYEVRKEYAKSEAAYRRALPIFRRTKGERSWNVAAIHNNLGVLYKGSGDYDAAQVEYDHAIGIWTESLGKDSPVLAHPYWGLSGVALARGDATTAVTYAEHCVRLQTKAKAAPGELAEANLALAKALWLQGQRRQEALAMARAAREVFATEGERRRRDLEDLDAWLAKAEAETPE